MLFVLEPFISCYRCDISSEGVWNDLLSDWRFINQFCSLLFVAKGISSQAVCNGKMHSLLEKNFQ